MIKAFFVEKNVDRALSYVNPYNFTWIGPGESDVLTNIDDIRDFFQKHCNTVASAYKLVSEEYVIGGSSYDSCIVIAKINFKGLNQRHNYQSSLHLSFYLQLINDNLLVSHYHVHIPIKRTSMENAEHFMMNNNLDNPGVLLLTDLQYQNSLLNKFLDSRNIAMKTFCYEEDLPYCYVNQKFLTLVGFHNLKQFILHEKFSSLAHIHPDDQQRYLQHLQSHFPQELTLNPSQEWQWHASYYIIYRTQTFDKPEQMVFEWGNLFTLNGHPIINSFVIPLEENNKSSILPPPSYAIFDIDYG